ncbi:MAG: type II toxin-antitoxin system death-on-curing family toxin [Saprospiraceae bacterium]
MDYLEIEDFEQIVDMLQLLRAEFTEDIPDFETRYTGILEGIIGQIKANYYGRELYKGIVNKAVMMFYCLVKNHPFFNGNKRVAVVALYEFLKRNTNELYIDENNIWNNLSKMAIRASESDPEEMELVKNYLKRKIRSFIIEF